MSLVIYIHWPFCKKKCPYCDFNSHVNDEIDHDLWAKALEMDIQKYAQQTKKNKVSAVFFGGGTPSLMMPETVEKCLTAIKGNWDIASNLEVSLEANPTSSEAEKFNAFRQAGVNRLSIGVQAFEEESLKFLGREHNVEEAKQAIKMASDIFDRYSFDLIYGRPGQTPLAWKGELEEALTLKPEHISVYQLTIEQGTAFYTAYNRGDFLMPDSDLEADFYDATCEVLDNAGLKRYEISNHAASGQECRHNLAYWRYDDYIGVGPGAHGRFIDKEGHRFGTREHKAPDIWLKRQLQGGSVEHERELITNDMAFEEMLMMGLRLKTGVKFDEVMQKTGTEFFERMDKKKLDQMQDEGYISYDQSSIQATDLGFKTLNSLLAYVLAD